MAHILSQHFNVIMHKKDAYDATSHGLQITSGTHIFRKSSIGPSCRGGSRTLTRGGSFHQFFLELAYFLTKPHPFSYCSMSKRGVLLSLKNPPGSTTVLYHHRGVGSRGAPGAGAPPLLRQNFSCHSLLITVSTL